MWVIQLFISTVIASPHQFVWHFELVSYKTLLKQNWIIYTEVRTWIKSGITFEHQTVMLFLQKSKVPLPDF